MRGVTEGPGGRAGTVRLRLDVLPGLVRAGSHEMGADPALAALAAVPDREFLGRIEREQGAWRLIAFKPVAKPRP